MKTQFVSITSNEEGQKVIPSQNNPEYGYIRVEQTADVFVDGWLRTQTRSALIKGKVSQLERIAALGRLEGKIVILEYVESELPENLQKELDKSEKFRESSIKKAGLNGPVLTKDGEDIYRFEMFVSADSPTGDVLVKHDNVEQVREWQAEQKAIQEAKNKKGKK